MRAIQAAFPSSLSCNKNERQLREKQTFSPTIVATSVHVYLFVSVLFFKYDD
jgi:hypothetical protein